LTLAFFQRDRDSFELQHKIIDTETIIFVTLLPLIVNGATIHMHIFHKLNSQAFRVHNINIQQFGAVYTCLTDLAQQETRVRFGTCAKASTRKMSPVLTSGDDNAF